MPVYEITTAAGKFRVTADTAFADEEEARQAFADAFTSEGIPARHMRQDTGVTRSFGDEFVGPPEPEPSFLERAGPTAVRLGGGLLSGTVSAAGIAATPVTGPAGPIVGLGLGAGIGYKAEEIAQRMEIDLGVREEESEGVKALEAALGIVPFTGAATTVGRTAVRRGLQSGALAFTGGQGRSLIETGELQPLEESALETGAGVVLGGGLGAVEGVFAVREAARRARFTKAEELAKEVDELGVQAPETADINPDALELAARQGRVNNLEQELTATKDAAKAAKLSEDLDMEQVQLAALKARAQDPAPVLFGPDGKPLKPTLEPLLERTASASTIEKITDEIASQSDEALKALSKTPAGKRKMRLYTKIRDALESGDIEIDQFARILARHNMGVTEFYEKFAAPGVRSGAQKLAHLSVLQRKLNRMARKDPALRKALKANHDLAEETYWAKGWEWLRELDATRRIFMLGQLVTGTRNAATTAGRFSLDIVEQAMKDVMPAAWGGGPGQGRRFASAWEHMAATAGAFKRGDTKRIESLLDVVDKSSILRERLFQSPTETDAIAGRIGSGLTWWTRQVENYYRRAKFQGALNSRLIKRGVSPADAWNNPKLIKRSEIEGAIRESLEVTFQAPPSSPRGRAILRGFQELAPVTTNVLPYPKYFSNAMKFLMDFNPAGFLKFAIMGKAKRAKVGAETLSRAMLGTTMLAASMAFHMSPNAGERWMEVKGDDGRVININDELRETEGRSNWAGTLGPFAPYMFMGKLMAEGAEHGANWARYNISAGDWMAGMVGFQRVPPGINAFVDTFRSGGADNLQNFQRAMGRFVGESVAGFTVPLRTLKDILSAVGVESEAKFFDPKEPLPGMEGKFAERFLTGVAAPTIQNIPLAGRFLDRPEAIQITRGEPRTSALKAPTQARVLGVPLPFKVPGQVAPFMRQTGGVIEQEKTKPEIALDDLGINYVELSPKTGIPAVDRALSQRFGRAFDRVFDRFITNHSDVWEQMTPERQEVVIKGASGYLHELARKDLIRTDPHLAAARHVKMKFGRAERELLKSEGVDIEAIVRQLLQEAK